MFSYYFNILISKMNFKNKKKRYLYIFLIKSHFKK